MPEPGHFQTHSFRATIEPAYPHGGLPSIERVGEAIKLALEQDLKEELNEILGRPIEVNVKAISQGSYIVDFTVSLGHWLKDNAWLALIILTSRYKNLVESLKLIRAHA